MTTPEALAQEHEDRSKERLAEEYVRGVKCCGWENEYHRSQMIESYLSGFSACEQSHAKTVNEAAEKSFRQEIRISELDQRLLTAKSQLAESLAENVRLRKALEELLDCCNPNHDACIIIKEALAAAPWRSEWGKDGI